MYNMVLALLEVATKQSPNMSSLRRRSAAHSAATLLASSIFAS